MSDSAAVLSIEEAAGQPSAGCFDVAALREQFPILSVRPYDKALVYLDSAATSQKPQVVIDAISRFYETHNANVHRGVHYLSERATEDYERARSRVASFIGAEDPAEVVFTRGTTESINLVAQSYGRAKLQPGDEVLVTEMEHHSNIVPWQMICAERGARLRVVPINDRGELDLEAFEGLLTERTKVLALAHVSNVLGTVNPLPALAAAAHRRGAVVVCDGAQAAPHLRVDVAALGCDFYAFSGHKMYGPTGIGVLWGRRELLEEMPPYQGGGDMILSVSFEKTTYNELPHKFEAGTPDLAGAVGLGVAVEFLQDLRDRGLEAHERELLQYAHDKLGAFPGLRIIGTAKDKVSVVSFVLEDVHPHDIGTVLDRYGIAVRSGHHCAQPLMGRLGLPATARASLGCYSSREDIDALVEGLHRVEEAFA